MAPWAVAYQVPLSMKFSRQEYLSGLSFPTPGALPDPGIKPESLESPALASRLFTTVPLGKPGGPVVRNPPANAGYMGSIPVTERSPHMFPGN